jgi:superfamily II DNA/RNA helicase
MQEFRDNKLGVLVATNVAARGLDVDHVELVINYELPESPELLTHRVGRTGRMGREGCAYTLVADTDGEQWSKLKKGLKQNIRPLQWEGAVALSSGPQRQGPAASRTTAAPRQAASQSSAMPARPGDRRRRRR